MIAVLDRMPLGIGGWILPLGVSINANLIDNGLAAEFSFEQYVSE